MKMKMSVPAAPIGDEPGFEPEYSVTSSDYTDNVEIKADEPKYADVELSLLQTSDKKTVVAKDVVRVVPLSEISTLRAHWGQLNSQFSGASAPTNAKRYSPLRKVTRYVQHPSLIQLSQKQGGGAVQKQQTMKFADYIAQLQANEQATDKLTYNVELLEVAQAPAEAPKPKPVFSIHYFTVDHENSGPSKDAQGIMATLDEAKPKEKEYVYPQYKDEPVWIPQNLVTPGSEHQRHVEDNLPLTPFYRDEWDAQHPEAPSTPVQEGPGAEADAKINPTVTIDTKPQPTAFVETTATLTVRRRAARVVPHFLPDPHLIEMEFSKLSEPAAAAAPRDDE